MAPARLTLTSATRRFRAPSTLFASAFVGLVVACTGLIQAQDFPLRGQTWVFLNGPNEDTHIVRSIGGFAPSSVIVAEFNPDGTANFRYSNLSGRFIKSTTEALDSIGIDLRRNVLRGTKLLQVSRQPVPDTAYSCDEKLAELATQLRYSRFLINGEAVAPTRDSRAWKWFYETPDCYASRPARAQDKAEKNLCQNGWCIDPTAEESDPVQEACDEAYTECRQGVEESEMRSKPSTRYFWNVHLFPKIIMHPRNPVTGRIIKEESMGEDEAFAKRQQAISHSGDADLKPYLNPALDDSASVYFSGQFLAGGDGEGTVSTLSFDVPADGEGGTGFYHDPPAAYRIASFDDWYGLQTALLLPFAGDESEKAFLTDLDKRCPGWAFQDRIIGQGAFEVKDNLDVTLPDILPASPSDPTWTRIRQERVNVDGGVAVRTIVEEDRILNGQRALVRKKDFPYGDYFWKGCPDLDDGSLRMTRSQLARILALPVPTCDLAVLSRAEALYAKIVIRFKADADAEERALALRRAQEAAFQYARTKDKERPTGFTCPDTPLGMLVRRVGGP